MADIRNVSCDILIVGAGIAGSAVTCALRGSGLKIVIIEKDDGLLDTARGDHLKPSTCQLLSRWGVLPDFFKHGAQKRFISKWRRPTEQPFYTADYAQLKTPHNYFAYLRHEVIGELLLRKGAADSNVTLLKPCQSWRLEDSSSTTPSIRATTVDQTYLIQAKVLLGADGRASKIRQLFDFKTHIKKYNRPLVVLFGRPKDSTFSNELLINVCKDRLISIIPRAERDCKVAIPENRTSVRHWSKATEAELKERLLTYLPDIPFESLSFADTYSPVDLQTEKWVKNNIVLLGDSCHALHPARSEGMNLCIANADKLATHLKQNPTDFTNALIAYENQNIEATRTLLKNNQRYAEMMDAEAEDTYNNLTERLAALAGDPEAASARLISTAGY